MTPLVLQTRQKRPRLTALSAAEVLRAGEDFHLSTCQQGDVRAKAQSFAHIVRNED
jgi:hypothetical protein